MCPARLSERALPPLASSAMLTFATYVITLCDVNAAVGNVQSTVKTGY